MRLECCNLRRRVGCARYLALILLVAAGRCRCDRRLGAGGLAAPERARCWPTGRRTRSRSIPNSCSRSTSPIRWTRRSRRCSARAISTGITSREFMQALRGGMHGKVAVTYFEWAGPYDQKIVVPWRLIDGPEAADAFANEIARAPYRRASRTSISRRAEVRQAAVRRLGLSAASAASSTCRATAPTISGPLVDAGARRPGGGGHHHQRPADHAQAAELVHAWISTTSTSTTRIA